MIKWGYSVDISAKPYTPNSHDFAGLQEVVIPGLIYYFCHPGLDPGSIKSLEDGSWIKFRMTGVVSQDGNPANSSERIIDPPTCVEGDVKKSKKKSPSSRDCFIRIASEAAAIRRKLLRAERGNLFSSIALFRGQITSGKTPRETLCEEWNDEAICQQITSLHSWNVLRGMKWRSNLQRKSSSSIDCVTAFAEPFML